jgi:hypothetical protein
MKKHPQPRYPAHQLVNIFGDMSTTQIAIKFGVNRMSISRWRNPKTMLNQWEADRYAIRIGKHPSEIWADWFDIDC